MKEYPLAAMVKTEKPSGKYYQCVVYKTKCKPTSSRRGTGMDMFIDNFS